MTVQAFRIAKARYSRSKAVMLSGRGALLYGGRWSSPGRPVLYTSGSAALATLEIAVHLNAAQVIPAFKILELTLPGTLILTVEAADLPRGWDVQAVNPSGVQAWGDVWFDEQISAVLEVPSAIIPTESNYLINPTHPQFGRIKTGDIQPHPFDARIKT